MLPGDARIAKAGSESVVTLRSWREAYRARDFCEPGDKRVHLGLIPQPFCGDVRRASVYILLLNPGLGPQDYYGEYEVQAYRKALLANLRQEWPRGVMPFTFLDPRFAWHGGFEWWHGKLAGVIQRLATAWDVPFSVARAELGARLASIELFPYHSTDSGGLARWLRDGAQSLSSVSMARTFVSKHVLSSVRRGKALVIVTRKAKAWDLRRDPGIVVYSAAQARGAHLTPESTGGKAIIRHLVGHRPGSVS